MFTLLSLSSNVQHTRCQHEGGALSDDNTTPLLGVSGGASDSQQNTVNSNNSNTNGTNYRWSRDRWTSPAVRRPGSGLTRTAITYIKGMVGTYVLYLPHAFAGMSADTSYERID
jgi:hypothetical protein